jgi:peptidyl-prolyl cis-trans isomerase D
MATLERIRSKAGLLIFIIAFALLCFIIGDFLTSSTTLFNMSKNVVGKVDGEKLSIEDFTQQSETFADVQKMQNPQPVSDAENKDMTWNNYMQGVLLKHEAEAAGITVTAAELTDQTVGPNTHPMLRQCPLFFNQEGQFDKSILLQVFQFIQKDPASVPDDSRENFVEQQTKVNNMWMFWENNLKDEILYEKVVNLVGKAMSAPKAEVKILASLSSNEYDALVASRPIASIADKDVNVSDQEMQDYYNKMKDFKFKTEGYRNLQVVLYPIQPSQNDYKEAKAQVDGLRHQLDSISDNKQLKLLFESSSEHSYPFTDVYRKESDMDRAFASFAFSSPVGTVSDVILDGDMFKTAKVLGAATSRPDSVKVSMIALQGKDEADCKKRADSVVAAIKAGAKFEDMLKLSADKASAQKQGDLGWLREGTISMEGFDDKAFTASVGTVFSVSNKQASFVIKVTDKTAPVRKAKVAVLAVKFEPSSATNDSIYNLANQFATKNKNIKSFLASAKKQNLMVRPLTNLLQNQPTTYVLQDSRNIIKWAWDENTAEGSVSEVFDVPGCYVVAAVQDAVEKGVVPFEKAKEQIKTELMKQKKADKLVAMLKGVKSLSAVGKIDTVKAVNFSANNLDKALIGAITVSKVNQLSKPVKGENAVYMFQTTACRKSQVPAIDQRSVNQLIMMSASREFLDAAKDKADIVDNRYNFY